MNERASRVLLFESSVIQLSASGCDLISPRTGCQMLPHLIALAGLLAPIQPASHRAPTHQIRHIMVHRGVELEVLDWGGRGPALIFLAGFGNTGHVFDGFAPQFTNTHRVIALTRRGFGTSSHPRTGYDTRTLVSDIIGVLDSLRIPRATFVGHSFAGSELNYLGASVADRVARLIYLDASYDFPRLYADSIWRNAFPIPRPPLPVSADTLARRRWFTSIVGPGLPEDEIVALRSAATSPDLSKQLQNGAASSNRRAIGAPVLALWAAPRSVEDQYPYFTSLNAREGARLQDSFVAQESVRGEHLTAFQVALPGARVIKVTGGRHYLFLSHPQQVADAMRTFLASSLLFHHPRSHRPPLVDHRALERIEEQTAQVSRHI